MIALPLNDLEYLSDAIQIGPLHLANQPASPMSTYKKFRKKRVCQNTEGLGEYKLHQGETNLGMRESNLGQMEALESLVSRTTDL